MPPRPFARLACAAVIGLLAPALHARQLSTGQLLAAMRQPNELQRYLYLLQAMPRVRPADKPLAQQYFAFSESELGLYGEAVRDFPLKTHPRNELVLPTPPTWEAVDAADTIVRLAADRRVVMINEAHHDAHTRQLTLALLPRLRALGFTHLAIEALIEDNATLAQRGYPTSASGTEYLREPVYGELVREALRLGFVLVPYDPVERNPQDRELLQAQRLYRLLAQDPKARLLVHAGYAHIDQAPGRLGPVVPMAARLHALSGLDILSIDQTEVREEEPFNELQAFRSVQNAVRDGEAFKGVPQTQLAAPADPHAPVRNAYQQIIDSFHPTRPVVLRRIADGALWSARPRLYNVDVILPPANQHQSTYVHDRVLSLNVDGHTVIALPPAGDGHRPDWLSLDGQRMPLAIGAADLCGGVLPCLVEAHYANEPDAAIAADRYVFLEGRANNALWLRPGAYRLRSLDATGKVLAERNVRVVASGGAGATARP